MVLVSVSVLVLLLLLLQRLRHHDIHGNARRQLEVGALTPLPLVHNANDDTHGGCNVNSKQRSQHHHDDRHHTTPRTLHQVSTSSQNPQHKCAMALTQHRRSSEQQVVFPSTAHPKQQTTRVWASSDPPVVVIERPLLGRAWMKNQPTDARSVLFGQIPTNVLSSGPTK